MCRFNIRQFSFFHFIFKTAPFLRTEQHKYKLQPWGWLRPCSSALLKAAAQLPKEELQTLEVREKWRQGILIKQEKSVNDNGSLFFTTVLTQIQRF